MKVKMLECLSGAVVRNVGEVHDFSDEQAVRLIDAKMAEPVKKADYTKAVEAIEKQKELQDEAEKQAAAILHKEQLQDERTKLQSRVDEITDVLGDAGDYYKSYIALAEDLTKKGESHDAKNGKEDDLSKDKEGEK